MTTGRINQIANMISPTHAEGDPRVWPSLRGVRGETSKRLAPKSLEISRLKSLAVRSKTHREGNREAKAHQGSEHLTATAHGRDVFPLLTHKPSVTRKDPKRKRTPSRGARRRLVTVVPKRAYVRSSLPTARESGAQSWDQWFARYNSCVEDRQATQTSPKHQRDR